MPDYLERVVTAGARTDTFVRPAVAAPPLLPGFGRLWLPPSESAEMAVSPPDILQEGEGATPHEPVPPAPAPSALPATLAIQATRLDAGAPAARPLIQAPTALRPVSQPVPEMAPPEPPRPRASTPTPGHGSAAAPPRPQPQPGAEAASPLSANTNVVFEAQSSVRSGSEEELSFHVSSVPVDSAPSRSLHERESAVPGEPVPPAPAPSALPARLAIQATRPDAGAPAARPLIQAPTALRPVSQPVPEMAPPEPPRPRASTPTPGHASAATPPRPQPQPGAEMATEGAVYSLQAHAQPLQEQGTSPPTMRPTLIWQAPAASLPPSSSGPQSRITIGRIDVQVNNHPPVIPSSPPPIASALPLNNWETRFLNRFPIRP